MLLKAIKRKIKKSIILYVNYFNLSFANLMQYERVKKKFKQTAHGSVQPSLFGKK